jgi:imidazolonepropionase-like amidohydrolase
MPVEDVLTAMVAGSLRPGAPGDLVGLAADPFDGLAALGDLRLVMRVGRIIRRT